MKLCIEQGVDFAISLARKGMENPAKKHTEKYAKKVIKVLVILISLS